MSDTEQLHHKPREIKRHANEEDAHPLIANLFFCYFFPYICRRTPLTDPDMPIGRKSDDTKDATRTLKARWQPEYDQYAQRRKQYEEKIKQNPTYVILPLQRNSYLLIFIGNNIQNQSRHRLQKPCFMQAQRSRLFLP